MKTKFAITLFLMLFLYGCANPTASNVVNTLNKQSEQDGSPFRWVSQNVSGGGAVMHRALIPLPSAPTKADETLNKDTLALINKAEQSKGRSNATIRDVKHMQDGKEVWILNSAKESIGYIVNFQPSPQGGIDINISGPFAFKE